MYGRGLRYDVCLYVDLTVHCGIAVSAKNMQLVDMTGLTHARAVFWIR